MTKEELKELLLRVWQREDSADDAFEALEMEMRHCIRGDGVMIYQIDLIDGDVATPNKKLGDDDEQAAGGN